MQGFINRIKDFFRPIRGFFVVVIYMIKIEWVKYVSNRRIRKLLREINGEDNT